MLNFKAFTYLNRKYSKLIRTEPVFLNLSRSPGIDSQLGKIDSSESIPRLYKRLQIRAQLFNLIDFL
jgi:hypothetical protein